MNSSVLCLCCSGAGILAGSVLQMAPRNAIAAVVLNAIPAIGWYLGTCGVTCGDPRCTLGVSMIAFGTPVALLYSYHTVRSPRLSLLAGFSLFAALVLTSVFLWLLLVCTIAVFR